MKRNRETEDGLQAATKRLEELISKRSALKADFEGLGARLTEQRQRHIVEGLLDGGDLDDLLEPIREAREGIRERLSLLNKAISEQQAIVQRERQAASERARQERLAEYEEAVKAYSDGLSIAKDALARIDELNRELAAQGFAGWDPLPLPVNFQGWERRAFTFREACRLRGIN